MIGFAIAFAFGAFWGALMETNPALAQLFTANWNRMHDWIVQNETQA